MNSVWSEAAGTCPHCADLIAARKGGWVSSGYAEVQSRGSASGIRRVAPQVWRLTGGGRRERQAHSRDSGKQAKGILPIPNIGFPTLHYRRSREQWHSQDIADGK